MHQLTVLVPFRSDTRKSSFDDRSGYFALFRNIGSYRAQWFVLASASAGSLPLNLIPCGQRHFQVKWALRSAYSHEPGRSPNLPLPSTTPLRVITYSRLGAPVDVPQGPALHELD